MGHNVSREKQERLDRQITILQSIERGWLAKLWCPGCQAYKVAPYAHLIRTGVVEQTWVRAMRGMRCAACRRRPATVWLTFGAQSVLLLRASSIGLR